VLVPYASDTAVQGIAAILESPTLRFDGGDCPSVHPHKPLVQLSNRYVDQLVIGDGARFILDSHSPIINRLVPVKALEVGETE